MVIELFEFEKRETRQISLKCIFWMFRTVELSMLWSNILIFHSHATLKMWSVQLHFFRKKSRIHLLLLRIALLDIELEQYLSKFFFAQSVFCCITYKFWFFFLVLLFNSEVSDANPVEKKPPCGDGEVWLWDEKPDESIWNAFIECFALAKNRCTDQKVWLSTPLILYKCEVAYWGFIFGIF